MSILTIAFILYCLYIIGAVYVSFGEEQKSAHNPIVVEWNTYGQWSVTPEETLCLVIVIIAGHCIMGTCGVLISFVYGGVDNLYEMTRVDIVSFKALTQKGEKC